MQEKSELLSTLPDDCKHEIARYLPTPGILKMSLASKAEHTLFQPLVDERKQIHQLLLFVVNGQYGMVENVLHNDISLLYKPGRIKDCSDREFFGDNEISAFEYVLWALDKHMWTTMMNCLPKDSKKTNELLTILRSQYNKVTTQGITYQLHGKTITESHFDFTNTIIKELQTQINSINAPGKKDWDAIDNHWRAGFGLSQKLAPIHVVDDWCSKEPFYPIPKFTSRPNSQKQVYNSITQKFENWFSCDSKLGLDFAIIKQGGKAMQCLRSLGDANALSVMLDAIKALYKIRTANFSELKSQLENRQKIDSQVTNLHS